MLRCLGRENKAATPRRGEGKSAEGLRILGSTPPRSEIGAGGARIGGRLCVGSLFSCIAKYNSAHRNGVPMPKSPRHVGRSSFRPEIDYSGNFGHTAKSPCTDCHKANIAIKPQTRIKFAWFCSVGCLRAARCLTAETTAHVLLIHWNTGNGVRPFPSSRGWL